MGNLFGRPKDKKSRVTEQDRAVLVSEVTAINRKFWI